MVHIKVLTSGALTGLNFVYNSRLGDLIRIPSLGHYLWSSLSHWAREIYVSVWGKEGSFCLLLDGGKMLLQEVFGDGSVHRHSSVERGDMNALPKLWPLSKLQFS